MTNLLVLRNYGVDIIFITLALITNHYIQMVDIFVAVSFIYQVMLVLGLLPIIQSILNGNYIATGVASVLATGPIHKIFHVVFMSFCVFVTWKLGLWAAVVCLGCILLSWCVSWLLSMFVILEPK